jgi:23S rRNA (uracil1939-C5)-methyltransferase
VRITLQIEDLAPGGEGVGHFQGRAVFVPFTAPGDRVEVEWPDRPRDATADASALHAELISLVAPGPVRTAPSCPHFGPDGDRCGGCEWQHASGLAQLGQKGRTLREALRRIGRIEPGSYEWLPPLASPVALRYRSRAKLHLDRGGGDPGAPGRLVFFERRSHRPVPVRECHLLTPGLEGLRAALGPAIVAAGLSPREVSLEWSERQGRGAAALLGPAAGARERARAEALLEAVPALAGVVLLADGAAPVLVGEPVLRHDRRPGVPASGECRSRPDVFAQANRTANALLVEAALERLAPDGEEVLELFCGSGNFTGPLSARARGVAAVEQQGPALELARADLGGERVRFFAGDALALTKAFARERGAGARRFGAALLDPPRDGAKGIGAALRALDVPRVVYVSCDPATLARDVRGAIEAGYRLASVQAVDLFPQTHHVEGIALLLAP